MKASKIIAACPRYNVHPYEKTEAELREWE